MREKVLLIYKVVSNIYIYKVERITKYILFFLLWAGGRIKGIVVRALGFEKIKKDH